MPAIVGLAIATLRAAARAVLLGLVAGLVLSLAPPAAEAETPQTAVTPELSKFLASPEHQRAVLEAARHYSDSLPDHCPRLTFKSTGLVTVLAPVKLDDKGHPTAGEWQESLVASGCGASKQFNVLTLAAPGKPVTSVALLPGDTKADPQLIRDTIMYAYKAAASVVPDCRKVIAVDTKFDQWDGGPVKNAAAGAEARPWKETWTIWACGKLVEVPIHFSPDQTGTQFDIRSSELHVRR